MIVSCGVLMLNKVLPRHPTFYILFYIFISHALYVNKLGKFKWGHRYRYRQCEERNVWVKDVPYCSFMRRQWRVAHFKRRFPRCELNKQASKQSDPQCSSSRIERHLISLWNVDLYYYVLFFWGKTAPVPSYFLFIFLILKITECVWERS